MTPWEEPWASHARSGQVGYFMAVHTYNPAGTATDRYFTFSQL